MLEYFPQGPAPEIDVEVVEVFDVAAMTGIEGRFDEIIEDGGLGITVFFIGPTYPMAGTGATGGGMGIGGRVAVVGGIAEAYQDGIFFFDLQGAFVLVGNGFVKGWEIFRLGVRRFEGVRQIDAGTFFGKRSSGIQESATDAEFGDGIGSSHDFKAKDILGQFRGAGGYSARTHILFNTSEGMFDHT